MFDQTSSGFFLTHRNRSAINFTPDRKPERRQEQQDESKRERVELMSSHPAEKSRTWRIIPSSSHQLALTAREQILGNSDSFGFRLVLFAGEDRLLLEGPECKHPPFNSASKYVLCSFQAANPRLNTHLIQLHVGNKVRRTRPPSRKKSD